MNLPATADERHERLLSEIVSSLQSVQKSISGMQAVEAGLLAAAERLSYDIADDGAHESIDLAQRSVAAEIATALRLSDRTVQGQMGDAAVLASAFPAVLAAFGEGRITRSHVKVICDEGMGVSDPGDRAAYAQTVMELAEQQAPGRLRALARRVAERFHARPLAERHEEAAAVRGVRVAALPDGMAELIAVLPAPLALGIHDRLSQMAHAVKASRADADGDDRGVDALRADMLAEMLLTAAPGCHNDPEGLLATLTARVEVSVPVLTLIGKDESVPAELEGYGPIDADTARVIAGAVAGWDRVLTHPVSGIVLSVDRYRPSEELRRHLRVRDRRCRFPGCGVRATRCDLDHTIDAAGGGKTCEENLATLCRRHHMLKHHSPWRVRQLGGGRLEFRSPTGRRYRSHPPGVLTGGPPATTVRFALDLPVPEQSAPF